jgi:hypothetical protein
MVPLRNIGLDWLGLILEYAMGSMTVAVSWSGYFNKMLKMFGISSLNG